MIDFSLDIEELTKELVDDEVNSVEKSQLLIYNDDYNTFDWVIESLMEVCKHTFEQSEQLSLIIHYKGKAVVKTASLKVLKPMKDALVDRGLSAVIESFVE
jgi:ATP-dependent Clp protease adaptor protein ClpS